MTDTIEFPVVPEAATLAQSMDAGFRKRLAYPPPLPSTVVPPRRRRRPERARRYRYTVGWHVGGVVLNVAFGAVLPPIAFILGGPIAYEVLK
ncbi:hypothetical protein [Promicromonospora sp. NPDC050880]|uniref:hypothetical protein n=1 Tax=Promicromonospora sp. NPDC050880 TaxID=3364406 RepID=UPI00379625EE